MSAGGAAGPRDAAASSTPGPTDDLVRLWVEVVRLGLDTFGQFLMPGGPGRPDSAGHSATLDVPTGASTGVVRVSSVPPAPPSDGGTDGAGAEVWLHNGSAADYSDVALHCGDLRASDGAVLPAASVRFDPSVVDLPARSSRGVTVSVVADVPPGTYRGVVLAAGRHFDVQMGWIGDLTPYLDRLDATGLWPSLPIVVVIDDGNGYRSIYAHLSKAAVRTGQTVAAGEFIGYEGHTGHASGCHLHYGLFSPQDGARFGIDPGIVDRMKLPAWEIARVDPMLVLPERARDKAPVPEPATPAAGARKSVLE